LVQAEQEQLTARLQVKENKNYLKQLLADQKTGKRDSRRRDEESASDEDEDEDDDSGSDQDSVSTDDSDVKVVRVHLYLDQQHRRDALLCRPFSRYLVGRLRSR
jgi:hypothetical protein